MSRLQVAFGAGIRSALLSWLCCATLFLGTAPALAGDIQVVVSRDVPRSKPLPRYSLIAIFGMRMTTWPDGTAIRVFVLRNDHPIHPRFCKEVLQVFPHQLQAAWDRLVFSGTGQAPEVVDSEEEMRERVSRTPGAIGYLHKDQIDNSVAILPLIP